MVRILAVALGLLLAVLHVLPLLPALATTPASPAAELHGTSPSSEVLSGRAPFNQPGHYPLGIRPDPRFFRPHAAWMGRLILPAAAAAAALPEDWVWIELEQAPPPWQHLVGRTVRLGWQSDPELQRLVAAVRTDVRLGAAARRLAAAGNVVPTRLDGRAQVGPLQSLAGARPEDDLTVRLEGVLVETSPGPQGETPGGDSGTVPMLRLDRPPVQTSGRWSALVRIVAAEGGNGPPADPIKDRQTDRYRVRHYNPASGRFDGPEQSLRIPVQPPDRNGRRPFDGRGLVTTAVGRDGWLVHGAPDADGLFTVQALEPRALFQLRPTRRIGGRSATLRWLHQSNWNPEFSRRGSFSVVELDPGGGDDPAWRLGDQALLIHSFGGIGGADGESTPAFTVTGHFAFGQAELVADPFTGEPRFALTYHQIYANNPNGIVAGSQDWSAYGGNLRRGWLGTRPFADGLVPASASALRQLALQSEVLMARYRSGDGSGVAAVTAATSCVQDSSQALFLALALAPRRDGLGEALQAVLAPFGIVRADWQHNARVLTGSQPEASQGFRKLTTLRAGLLSWRTMLPRRGYDTFSQTLLDHGHRLRLLRTNQLPGGNPRITPLAPTLLLGQLPLVAPLLRRLLDALFQAPSSGVWGLSLALLAGYGALVIPAGLHCGLLRWQRQVGGPLALLGRSLRLLAMPALVEELIFRVALLPQPLEGPSATELLGWSSLAVGLFVAYHPLAGRLWYRQGRRLFDDRRFLLACTLLGIVCSVAYLVSGSLWSPLLIHWLVVVIWLEWLGGRRLLEPPRNQATGSLEGAHSPIRRSSFTTR
jgi:predicted Abi (CAAX) family protease